MFFFFPSRRRHTRLVSDWSSDVCSSDLPPRKGVVIHPVCSSKWVTAAKQQLGTRLTIERVRAETLRLRWREKHGVEQRLRGRSEERRVGKEGRSRWSPYH